MTFITADRIKETTTVTGTGPITLLGAVSGYRPFSSVMLSIGDTCPYAIVNADASQWEVGIATYTDVNTLTRTTIHASTADPDTDPVDFTAGVKDVFLAPTARTVLSDITSNDGTVTLTKVGPIVDLSVAVAAATTNVIVQVRNNTGATLTKGTVVYINNALGQIPTVAKALATSDATSAQTLGMISADLANNSNGYVTIIGLIDDISLDTGIYSDGDQLYLSGTTAGAFTNVKPYAPTHLVYVGVVEHAHNVHGKIFVKVQNGYELDELHNVAAQSPSNGQTIVYNSTNQLWEKNTVSLTAGVNGTLPVANGGTGVTTSTGTGSVVLSSAPTLTTATFAAGTISASAPNTITQTWNNAAVTFSALTTNITNAASAVGSMLVNLQVDGANKFSIRKDGNICIPNGASIGTDAGGLFSTNDRILISNQNMYFYVNNWGVFCVAANSSTPGVIIGGGLALGFGSALGSNSGDLLLYRDAADTLAQRRSTNAQTFRVYNTYTDASNYERLGITWASNICTIGVAQAGTGSVRSLVIAGANATSGAGGNVTITAGSGSGVGAGGNIILQPGAQGTSGGNGVISVNDSSGIERMQIWHNGTNCNIKALTGVVNVFGTNGGREVHFGGVSGVSYAGIFIRNDSDASPATNGFSAQSGRTYAMNQGGTLLPFGASKIFLASSTNTGTISATIEAAVGVLKVWAAGASPSIGGSLSFPSSTTAIATSQNDLILPASAFQRINCTSPSSITGIAPPTGGTHVDGRMIRVYNVGTANLTLSHNSVSSAAANRFYNATGADIILAPNDYAELIYDSTNNGSGSAGWRVS